MSSPQQYNISNQDNEISAIMDDAEMGVGNGGQQATGGALVPIPSGAQSPTGSVASMGLGPITAMQGQLGLSPYPGGQLSGIANPAPRAALEGGVSAPALSASAGAQGAGAAMVPAPPAQISAAAPAAIVNPQTTTNVFAAIQGAQDTQAMKVLYDLVLQDRQENIAYRESSNKLISDMREAMAAQGAREAQLTEKVAALQGELDSKVAAGMEAATQGAQMMVSQAETTSGLKLNKVAQDVLQVREDTKTTVQNGVNIMDIKIESSMQDAVRTASKEASVGVELLHRQFAEATASNEASKRLMEAKLDSLEARVKENRKDPEGTAVADTIIEKQKEIAALRDRLSDEEAKFDEMAKGVSDKTLEKAAGTAGSSSDLPVPEYSRTKPRRGG